MLRRNSEPSTSWLRDFDAELLFGKLPNFLWRLVDVVCEERTKLLISLVVILRRPRIIKQPWLLLVVSEGHADVDTG